MPDQLGHYEILGKLGEGGMGQVFRARDTRLGREVALKLLPPEFTRDPERSARLEREARLLASLNHPHIAGLHGLEQDRGRLFLVMELVEGTNLAARLAQGPMPLDSAIDLALQLAGGLEAAHAKGIVHRDLKPANVVVTHQGTAKLLDFGLARAFQGEDGDPSASPTITAAMTQAGVILGTAAYMSPEQARGKVADRQSDIWSFGVLLYEMLTSHRVFAGETISDSIGAILHKEPEWDRLPPATPPQLRQLLRRCLERDPDRRLHDIGDARVALEEARQDPTGSSFGMVDPKSLPAARGRRGIFLATATGLLALLAGLVLGRVLAPEPPVPALRKLQLGGELLDQPFRDGTSMALSPDGRHILYRHEDRLRLRPLGSRDSRVVEGSERGHAPFWSPDGHEFGWFSGNMVLRSSLSGGRPVPVCELPLMPQGGMGASWGEDGRLLIATGTGPILSVSARGGKAVVAMPTPPGVQDLHEPHHLPGDAGVVMVAHPDSSRPNSLQLYREGSFRELWRAGEDDALWSPCYDPAGYLLVARAEASGTQASIWALRFDPGPGEATGEAFLVEPRAHRPSVSRDGVLAYVADPDAQSAWSVRRIGFDGSDHGTLFTGGRGMLEVGGISPDGTRVCYVTQPTDGGASELFVRDLGGGTELRLTRDGNEDVRPMWHPDGESIIYISLNFSRREVLGMRIPADGGADPVQLVRGGPTAIIPPGDELLFVRTSGLEQMTLSTTDTLDIWALPLDGGQPRLLYEGDQTVFPLDVDPSGNYALFGSSIVGNRRLYLSRLPTFRSRWAVSDGEDMNEAVFHPEGTHIYYLDGMVLYGLELRLGGRPSFGERKVLATLPPGSQPGLVASPQGLLVVVPAERVQADGEEARVPTIQLATSWSAPFTDR